MSNSSKPRVVRKHKPKKVYRLHNYRSAFPLLMEDFEERCAYSLVHVKSVSEGQIQVDHYDSRKKKACTYDNLFPAYAICNLAKSDHPREGDRILGLRLINPCLETEYGEQIFEDPKTHELIGINPVATYHIDIMDLNNPTLVHQRWERSQLTLLLQRRVYIAPKHALNDADLEYFAKTILQILKYKIPPIPAPTT